MDKKGLAIGVDSFKEIIIENGYYIDKTDIIEELINDLSEVKLFPRPRRFGKSITLSMLDYFFNIKKKEIAEDLFKGLKVEKSKKAAEYKSQYPVIFLNLKGIKGNSWEDIFPQIKIRMAKIYDENEYVCEKLNENELQEYKRIQNKIADKIEYQYSLKNMTEYLNRYYKKQVIVLIDEYDAPIDNAYNKGFYEETMDFFRSFNTEALKTNEYLKFAVLTGVVRISSESMFSELNHLSVYGINNKNYNQYFGFTEEEVEEMLRYYELEDNFDEVKKWYNGYKFAKKEIYNPWSILSYIKNEEFESYWVNTGENTLLKSIIENSSVSIKPQIEKLLNGEKVLTRIEEKISYRDLVYTDIICLTMLLLSGYLTVENDELVGRQRIYELTIPNEEIKAEIEKILENWVIKQGYNKNLEMFKVAVLTGNAENIEKALSEMILNTASFYDTTEQCYHAFALGVLQTLGDSYLVKSNREIGYRKI